VNRTRGFVNLNRFKSGRTIKRFKKVADKYRLERQRRGKVYWDTLYAVNAGNACLVWKMQEDIPNIAKVTIVRVSTFYTRLVKELQNKNGLS